MLSILLAMLLQLPAAAGIVPATLVKAVAPIPPPNAVAGTCVLADISVDQQGRVGEIKVLQGLGPFNESAAVAIKQWMFTGATAPNAERVDSRVGVLTVFRPAAIGNTGVGGPAFGYKEPTALGKTHAPMPRTFEDPGYPPNTTATGVVIIEVTIDMEGIPSNLRTVQDVPPLTTVTRSAIQSWKFIPAMKSGEPVEGTLVVVMSFVRPVAPGK